MYLDVKKPVLSWESTTPAPFQPVLTLTPVIAEIYPGQSAKFEVSYNGSDSLKAYIQIWNRPHRCDECGRGRSGLYTAG